MKGKVAGGAAGTAVASDEPRDAKAVKDLLRSMGVEEGEYEPRVVHQFLELAYRYIVDVLSDAQVYAKHAVKPVIDQDDLRLAIQSKVNFSFSQPPAREALLELTRSRNKIPLHKSLAPPGSIPVPAEQDTLISPNYQLLIHRNQPTQVDAMEEKDEDEISPEQRDIPYQQTQQRTPQRVSFPLTSAAKQQRFM